MWAALDAEGWTDLHVLAARCVAVGLQPKTAVALLDRARSAGFVERRGSYSRKHRTDTRQYRRHPKAAA